jgi:hypothetical protein
MRSKFCFYSCHNVVTVSTHPINLLLTQGRTTLYDDREDGEPYAVGNFVVDRPRLPIGFFELISQADVGAVCANARFAHLQPL